MFPSTADHAFRRFQRSRNPAALATVFDRTAPELLRLARHLAPDETTAEDLLQATFVSAIEAVDDYDSRQRVLPWLLGILANHARAARRRARRAPDPERLRTEPVADPGRTAEERELRAELSAAIARLPDHYRPVLRLHLEQGMPAQDIARTLERPPGTVRAQIARGLQLVRRSLPVGLTAGAAIASTAGRGLAAVRAAVLGRWQPKAGGTVGALSTGAILMLHKNLIVALSAALLFLISAVAVLMPNGDGVPPVAKAGTQKAPRVHAPPADEPVVSETVETGQRELAASESHGDQNAKAPAPTASGSLRVRVKRPGDSVPAAGIGVAIRDVARLQDLAHAPRFVRTDPRGEVAFADVESGSYMIELDRAGRVGVAAVAAGEEAVHEVVLPGGVAVEGTVVDGSGVPIPGAAIVLHASRMGTVQVAESDGAGRFAVRDLAEHTELQARKAGHAPSLAHPVIGRGSGAVTMRLLLEERGHRVQGRVTDLEGKSVAGASLALVPAGALDVHPFDRGKPQARAIHLRADDAGTFVCDEAPAGRLVVLANADGSGTAPAVVEVEVEGDTWVELRLPNGGTIEGRITRDGAPLAGVDVSAFVEEPEKRIGALGNLLGLRRATTAADGSFRIDGMMPGRVHLRAYRGIDGLGETRVQVADGEVARWILALGESLALRVRVTPPVDPRTGGPWMLLLSIPSQNTVRPGMLRDGVSEFAELPEGDCSVEVVRLQGRDLVVLARQDRLRAGQEATLEIPEERLAICRLRGRAVDPLRAPIRGGTVTIRTSDNRALRAHLERTTGDDGAFESGVLPPGSYRINLRTGDGETYDGGTHVLTAGQDLDLGDVVFEVL